MSEYPVITGVTPRLEVCHHVSGRVLNDGAFKHVIGQETS